MRINNFMRRLIMSVFVLFCAGIFGVTLGLYSVRGLQDRELLAQSIESQLRTIVTSASERIVPEDMLQYSSLDAFFADGVSFNHYNARKEYTGGKAALTPHMQGVMDALDEIREISDAVYIYTVMKVGDVYRIVYDTDEKVNPFLEYELDQVHLDAFAGENAAGLMNVTDDWGTFNTGAMPLYDSSGKTIIGIVCADIEDEVYAASIKEFTAGIITISIVLTVVLTLFAAALLFLLNHIRRIQNHLNDIANHDMLTDLPNRRYLLKQLSEMTVKQKSKPFALFFIDLDNFKKVNDNAGHDAGDELLRHIANYLQSAHKTSKVFRMSAGRLDMTARVGGDEFIMIVPGMDNEQIAAEFAQELLDGFGREHIDKYIKEYEVGLSIGIAIYPLHVDDFHILINYADMAMYGAKKSGKNRYCIYSDKCPPMD